MHTGHMCAQILLPIVGRGARKSTIASSVHATQRMQTLWLGARELASGLQLMRLPLGLTYRQWGKEEATRLMTNNPNNDGGAPCTTWAHKGGGGGGTNRQRCQWH